MFGLEMPEILLIGLVVAVLFGADKIGKLANSMGRFSGEFQKGKLEIENEIKNAQNQIESSVAANQDTKAKKS
jgi:sec-independent protein translocase protein TatA